MGNYLTVPHTEDICIDHYDKLSQQEKYTYIDTKSQPTQQTIADGISTSAIQTDKSNTKITDSETSQVQEIQPPHRSEIYIVIIDSRIVGYLDTMQEGIDLINQEISNDTIGMILNSWPVYKDVEKTDDTYTVTLRSRNLNNFSFTSTVAGKYTVQKVSYLL